MIIVEIISGFIRNNLQRLNLKSKSDLRGCIFAAVNGKIVVIQVSRINLKAFLHGEQSLTSAIDG